jgi:two-component system, cell cycle sensor histidine kinase and response regulator CckA
MTMRIKGHFTIGSTVWRRVLSVALRILVPLIWIVAAFGVPAWSFAQQPGPVGSAPAADARRAPAPYDNKVSLTPLERQWLARHDGRIRIGITVIPPQVLRLEGQYNGLSIDYIHLMERRIDCRFKLVPHATWNDVMQAAKSRRIDMIFAAQKTPDRLKYLLFTKPYIKLPNMIVVREDRQGGADLKDMQGWRVAASEGSAVHEYLKRQFTYLDLLPVPDELNGLIKVSMGEADAMVVEMSRASYYIERAEILNLRVSGSAGLLYRLRFAVRNDWPVLLGILDKGLASITDKEKRAINRRWIIVREKGIFTSRAFWIAFAAGLAVITLSIAGVLVWNRTLSRVVRQRTSQLQQELTERRQVEAALRESEEKYRRIVDTASEGIWVFAPDGRTVFVNARMAAILGYSPAEMIGRPVADFILEEDQPDQRRKIEDRRRGVSETYERRLRCKGGGIVWTQASVTAILDEAQHFQGSFGMFTDITSRKQAEEELVLRERQYRTLLENVPEFIVRYDRHLRLIYVNPAWENAGGLSAAEVVGMNYSDISKVPTPFNVEYVNKLRLALETRTSQSVAFTWVNAHGEKLFLEYVIVPEYDHQGRIAGVLAVGRDISERRQMEKERLAYLRFFENLDRVNRAIQGAGELETMMRDLLDIVLDIFDCDRAFLLCPCDPESPTWHIPMERTKPEYPGVRDLKQEMPMDTQVAETLRILLAANGPVVFGPGTAHALPEDVSKQFGIKCFMAMAIHPKTGSPWQFGIHQCAYARTWSAEEERHFQEIGRRLADGLSAMLAYRELRNSLEKLEQAQRIAHIGSWELDLIHNVLTWSDEAFRIFEIDPDLFGASYEAFLETVHPEDRKSVDLAYTNALKTRTPFAIDHRLLFPGGHIKYVHEQCETIYAGDEPIRSIGTVQDITERKQLEEQLRQSQKMEAVGQLAGGVAHDFNNMLGVIIGHAELALRNAALDNTLRKNIEEILEAARRSTEITRQLLAFARKQTIEPKILDMNETVDGILKLLRRLIGEDIDLVWLPGSQIWPVKMDPSQLDQILANLCVNARDAIQGVGKITIKTHNADFDDAFCSDHNEFHPGKYVVLAVSDNGSGMDKPTMDRIFEPFFTTKGKGTGMGLATVYGIVEQNAGFIQVSSKPGHGSTFRIYLPRHAAKASQESKARPEPSCLTGHETILVVEDEIQHLRMLELILEKYGYRVLAASSPGEALLAAKNHTGKIHMLLTDLIMPEMNGRDLAKGIISLCPETLCLFMSGYAGDVIAQSGVLDEGMQFIHKPFSNQALAVKVREVLDSQKNTGNLDGH